VTHARTHIWLFSSRLVLVKNTKTFREKGLLPSSGTIHRSYETYSDQSTEQSKICSHTYWLPPFNVPKRRCHNVFHLMEAAPSSETCVFSRKVKYMWHLNNSHRHTPYRTTFCVSLKVGSSLSDSTCKRTSLYETSLPPFLPTFRKHNSDRPCNTVILQQGCTGFIQHGVHTHGVSKMPNFYCYSAWYITLTAVLTLKLYITLTAVLTLKLYIHTHCCAHSKTVHTLTAVLTLKLYIHSLLCSL
jgi:hypothetical protein